MHHELNQLNQPIGRIVPNWREPPWPSREPLVGRYCRLEALEADLHASDLFAANRLDVTGANWTYLPYGPFETLVEFKTWIENNCRNNDPLFFAIIDSTTNTAVGVASFMDIKPASGSIEVGHLNFSPKLQRMRGATEAMYLMMARAFESGYRRYQWRCNVLNAPSRAAAQRLGLSFEGVFRQAMISKGRSRDTAWYAAIDSEWSALKAAFETWLDPANFDQSGRQRVRLSELTAPVLKQRG
jgi:RimJ/RimL family protein N-acetyltransferase